MDETVFENLQEARNNSVTKPYAEKQRNGFKFNEKPERTNRFYFRSKKQYESFKIQNDYRLL